MQRGSGSHHQVHPISHIRFPARTSASLLGLRPLPVPVLGRQVERRELHAVVGRQLLHAPEAALEFRVRAPQLKGMQEIITLLVFAGFSTWYLGETVKWTHVAAFVLIVAAAFLLFLD